MALARRTTTRSVQGASSSSQKLGTSDVFGRDWDLPLTTLSNGTQVLAQYRIHEPSGGRAYFNILLDASASMCMQYSVDGGRKLYVHEHLFRCFEDLVQSGAALRPDDMICVWSFNKRSKLLICEVEQKNFHTKKDAIWAEYLKELGNVSGRGQTRLYEAVATAMDTIRETREKNKKADLFLVVFTDGRDTGTGSTSLDDMMFKIKKLVGRLHTFFITLNLPTNSELCTTLEGRRPEMELIRCESSKPRDISAAFNTLRGLIKAVLEFVVHKKGAQGMPTATRLVQYGKTKEAIGDSMMAALATEMRDSSLLEAWGNRALTYR